MKPNLESGPEVENVHPGKAALDKVMFAAATKDTCQPDLCEAVVYLHERLAEVERKLAERERRFSIPTAQEVTAYAASIKFQLVGDHFCDYYSMRNWCIGKTKMKDWKAAVRTWKQRRDNPVPQYGKGNPEQSKFSNAF